MKVWIIGQFAWLSLLALAEVRGVPKEAINDVVKKHRSEVRECYETALKLNSTLKGKVVMAFDIQPDGKVSSVRCERALSRTLDCRVAYARLSRHGYSRRLPW